MDNTNQWNQKIEEYQQRLQKYGATAQALKWISPESMRLRYKQLLADIDLQEKRILDAGCGFGDIIQFIRQKSSRFSYLGVDMIEQIIEIARQRHPGFSFLVRNYFEDPMDESFDWVISSGTLNSQFRDAIRFRKQAIRTMFSHAIVGIAFNMAGSHPPPPSKSKSSIFYADSLEVVEFCLTLTQKVILRHHYHPKDFTVIMFR